MKRMGVLAVTLRARWSRLLRRAPERSRSGDKSKAPTGWWEMTAPTAIPPPYFDQVLSAYGLTLVDASKAPPTYARKVEDKVVWETAPRTYTPQELEPDPLGLRDHAVRRLEGAAHLRAPWTERRSSKRARSRGAPARST